MKRKWFGAACLLVLTVLAGWLASSQISLETFVDHEDSIRQRIAEHPGWFWVLGFFVYLALSVIPGTRGKAVVFGWLFGFWPGLILVNLALTVAAFIGFQLGRSLLREVVESRYALRLAQLNRALQENGGFYVLLLRIVPVSYSLTNYVLGATSLDRRTYWWGTQLGLLPGNIVFVSVGANLPSLGELKEQGLAAIFSVELAASLIGLSLFTLLVPPVLRRWKQHFGGRQQAHHDAG